MARILSYVLGVVMTLAGLLGFAMNGSVLGVFMAGTALSTLWVVAGVITLAVAVWMPGRAVLWAKVAGIILAIVAVLGFVMNGPVLGSLDNTMADNSLHLVLAIVFLLVGFVPMGATMERPATASMPPSEPAM